YINFVFSSRRLHTSSKRDWSSDVCSSDLSLNDSQFDGLDISLLVESFKEFSIGGVLLFILSTPIILVTLVMKNYVPTIIFTVVKIGRASCRERVLFWVMNR